MTLAGQETRAILLYFLSLLCLTFSVQADTFVVTKTEDDNGPCTPEDCALREAVMAANTTPEADRIELGAGVYTLTIPRVGNENGSRPAPESGDLDIVFSDLEIVGDPAGATMIKAETEHRVVEVGFCTVSFSNVEITGGRLTVAFGGCVRMIGSHVTFVDSSITDCYCRYEGGGLAVEASAVTFVKSTVSGNVSDTAGGGLYHSGFAAADRLTILNSTFSGNRAGFDGGGLYRLNSGEALIAHSTFARNEAPSGDAIFLNFPTGFTWVQNSILEGKCRGLSLQTRGGNLGGPDLKDHCFKNSIINDVAAENLGLGPLAHNGGRTRTHALLPGSPAIDMADPEECEAVDQRGVTRPVGAACDSGAVEALPLVGADIPVLGNGGLWVFALVLGALAVTALRPRAAV